MIIKNFGRLKIRKVTRQTNAIIQLAIEEKHQFEIVPTDEDAIKETKEEKISKQDNNDTSFNSKDASSDEESPRQKVKSSFLSNDSREGSDGSGELIEELESPEGKIEMNAESQEKVKIYTKSDWEKILEFDDLENTSTTEMLISLRHGIPFELYDIYWICMEG